MKCLYNTANRSQRIQYAHAKYKEGLIMHEIAYLLHTSAGTVGKYLAIPENEIRKTSISSGKTSTKKPSGKKRMILTDG